MRKGFCLIALAASALWSADRSAVNGTWIPDATHAAKLKIEALEIHQSADTVQVSEKGKSKKVDLECGSEGQTCKIKEASEDVSFWYNGPALVMMETRHGHDVVIQTRLEPSADGKTLRMEVVHIAPAGQKDESYTLTKQSGS